MDEQMREFHNRLWDEETEYWETEQWLQTPDYQAKKVNEIAIALERKKGEARRHCVQGSLRVDEFIRCMENEPYSPSLTEFEKLTLPLSLLFLNEGVTKCMEKGQPFEQCLKQRDPEFDHAMAYLKRELDHA